MDTKQAPDAAGNSGQDLTIREFQQYIYDRFYTPDAERGTPGTFLWFIEEVGELATALADGDTDDKAGEFADVFAWLCTLANINGVDLGAAARDKYLLNERKGHK